MKDEPTTAGGEGRRHSMARGQLGGQVGPFMIGERFEQRWAGKNVNPDKAGRLESGEH